MLEMTKMRATTALRGVIGAICAALLGLSAMAQRASPADVQLLADRWAAAYNKHDRDALGALYTDGARLMMHGATTIAGKPAIEEFWAGDFEDRDPLTLLKVTHSVTGSDMVLVHGDYEVVSRADGRMLGGGRFAHIWTRAPRNGEWRLDRDLWNEPFDPYTTAEASSDEVQKLAARWTEAYNKHDRAALQALYSDDARLMMHGAPTITGRNPIGEFWARDFTESDPLTLLKVTHALQGVDMVLVHGNYEVVDRVDGSKVGLGRFAHIWTADRNGDWRLDRDLWFERSEPAP
jgi:ketosteroid isomerase-like protein